MPGNVSNRQAGVSSGQEALGTGRWGLSVVDERPAVKIGSGASLLGFDPGFSADELCELGLGTQTV